MLCLDGRMDGLTEEWSQSIGSQLLPLLTLACVMEISCDRLAPLGGGYLPTGVVVN